MKKKYKRYKRVFIETFIILLLIYLGVFSLLIDNQGTTYDVAQFFILLFSGGPLIFGFFILLVHVSCGITCIKLINKSKESDKADLFKGSIIVMCLIYLVLFFLTLGSVGFFSDSASKSNYVKSKTTNERNNKKDTSNYDSTIINRTKYKKDEMPPKIIYNSTDQYDQFIELINSDNVLYRDDRDYGGFTIILTSDMKLVMYRVFDDKIVYVEMDRYLIDINNTEISYSKGYYADFNNGDVPNIRIRIDKYGEDQTLRVSYIWCTYDSEGNLLEISECK